jgi:hypothetical protein
VSATATDASRVCSLTATVNGTTVRTVAAGALSVATVLPAGATAADVEVSAVDCAGNRATRGVQASPTVVAESAGQVVGAWTTLTDARYLGGAAASAAGAGASMKWTFTGSQVVLFGSRQPTSGAVAVYLDDRLVSTVDTRGVAAHRQALWTRAVPPGTHTVRIVVVGTAGRPTVTVDGIATLP